MTISQPESKDQLAPTELTKDNTTNEKASSVTQDKNIIDAKHEASQNKLTILDQRTTQIPLLKRCKIRILPRRILKLKPVVFL